MADLFVSYARADREHVEELTRELEAEGFSVWWDASLRAGESFDSVIESELNAARAVVVVWSESSISRKWVRNEAREGEERGVLIPVVIDGCRPPIEFRNIQTSDLTDWNGSRDNPAWKEFIDSINIALSDPADRKARLAASSAALASVKRKRRRSGALSTAIVASAVILALAIAAFAFRSPVLVALNGGAPAVSDVSHALDPRHEAFWQKVEARDEKSEYEAYLEAFPNGNYAALARSRIKRLAALDEAKKARETSAQTAQREREEEAQKAARELERRLELQREREALAKAREAAAAQERLAAMSVSGVWNGSYQYGTGNRGVPFRLTLVERTGSLSGQMSEPATFGNGESQKLYASISGTRKDDVVSFRKTYDGTGGQTHSVYYEGKLSADRKSVEGVWKLSGTSGRFSMKMD